MKYKIFTLIAAVMLTGSVFAQSPEKMSYQAVVRGESNGLVTNQSVGMQISILQGGATGTPVYVETQTPTTNANGLVSIEIGTGTLVIGDFTTIDWANDTYFIKTETDPTGGSSYTITGTSQLMSVPYALHAKTADNVTNLNITGNEAGFTGWDKNDADDFDGDYNSLTNQPTIPTNTSDLTNDVGYITTFSEVDGSTTNEIQDLQLVSNNLTITNNVTPTTIDLSQYLDNTDTQLDSAGVATLGFVAGPHTVDTDTQLDSTDIANLGYVAGPHTVDTDTQLDSAGIAAFGYVAGYPQVGFNAFMSGNYLMPSVGWNTFVCDQELFDDGNGYDNLTGVFTAPESGVYLFEVGVMYPQGGQPFLGGVGLYHNGTFNGIDHKDKTTNEWMMTSGSLIIKCNAGDTVWPVGHQSVAGKTIYGDFSRWTTFSGVKVY